MTTVPTLKRGNATLDVWPAICPDVKHYHFRNFCWTDRHASKSRDSRSRNLVNIFGNLERALEDPLFVVDGRPHVATLVDPETMDVVEYVSLRKLVRLWPKWSRHSSKPPRTSRRLDCVAFYRSFRTRRDFVLKQTLNLRRDSDSIRVRRRGAFASNILVPGIYCPVSDDAVESGDEKGSPEFRPTLFEPPDG